MATARKTAKKVAVTKSTKEVAAKAADRPVAAAKKVATKSTKATVEPKPSVTKQAAPATKTVAKKVVVAAKPSATPAPAASPKKAIKTVPAKSVAPAPKAPNVVEVKPATKAKTPAAPAPKKIEEPAKPEIAPAPKKAATKTATKASPNTESTTDIKATPKTATKAAPKATAQVPAGPATKAPAVKAPATKAPAAKAPAAKAPAAKAPVAKKQAIKIEEPKIEEVEVEIEPEIVGLDENIPEVLPLPEPIDEPEPDLIPEVIVEDIIPDPVVVKKPKKVKAPVRKVIVMPPTSSAPLPAPKPVITRATPVKEEKKPGIVVATRKVDTKDEKPDLSKTMINYQPDNIRSILDRDNEPTGPVYRYSDDELTEFREIVTSRLEASRKDLTYLQGLLTRKDEAGTEDSDNRYMNMEDGSGAMEREQMAQLASRQIQLINNLEKAMMRIENKTYGICRVTGKLIDKARLRAVPHATLSIEAKNNMPKK